MVLHAVFLGTREEIDYLYHGGTNAHFPGQWQRLRNVVDAPQSPDYPEQLFEMMTGDDPNERERVIAEIMAVFEATGKM